MDEWSIALTVVIAFSTAVSATATPPFCRWTWGQRTPSPILTGVDIDVEEGTATFRFYVGLTNPGDAPIHVLGGWPAVRDDRTPIGKYEYPGDVGSTATVPAHGIASVRRVVAIDLECFAAAFPEGGQRLWDIELDYVSGGRRRHGTSRRAVTLTRIHGGWVTSPPVDYWSKPVHLRG